ncbi:MAG: two pore domain potassium channel family protein [Gammaproteobacteria bacterium]|nr:two pore domain potassium channel family protein [Gammaproteobacteria bacterium]
MSKSLKLTGVYLCIMLSAHIWAMMAFEKFSFGDAFWLTLTTVTTVGYGDLSAVSLEGRLSTILILFVGSVFVVAKAAGDYFDYRSNIRQRKLKGRWRWNMSGHIIIMNTPASFGEQYLQRLIKQFRASRQYENIDIELLTSQFPDGLPSSIADLKRVAHYHGRADDIDCMQAVNVQEAEVIIVLAKEEGDKASDGRTFDILHRLNELGKQGMILAECVDDDNRARLLSAGANIMIRPIRAYPEMIVRALVAPGSEQIIENMFSNEGDEYQRYDVNIQGMSWSAILCTLAQNDLGIAIGYMSKNDSQLQCNPPANEQVDAVALFLMVREESIPDPSAVQAALLQKV